MIAFPSCGIESMDGWYHFEDLDQRLSDGYWANSLSSTNNNVGGSSSLNLNGANLVNSDLKQDHNVFKDDMEMELKSFLIGEVFTQELSYEQSQPSSNLSSQRSRSIDSSDHSSTQIVSTNSFSSPLISQTNPPLLQAYNPTLNSTFRTLDTDDDAIITKAMVAIISTNSSVSSSSPPSVLSHSHDNREKMENQLQQGIGKLGAFSPFNTISETKFEATMEIDGQQMIKRSLSMLRSGSVLARESRPGSNQLYHMISERRRREKLNESFEMLRMLLPPGSKKDKTSVLINSTNYLKTLEKQIYELKEKTRKLETYLPNTDENKENQFETNGRAQVQITKTCCTTPGVQQINLRVTVMVECDVIELVLLILDSLKSMKIISLLSVDASTFNPHMNLHARASIKLRIKDCDWNETLFQETMNKIVDDVTSKNNTTSISACSQLSHLSDQAFQYTCYDH